MTAPRFQAFVDFINAPQFLVGVIVGAWFSVGAAFVVAF